MFEDTLGSELAVAQFVPATAAEQVVAMERSELPVVECGSAAFVSVEFRVVSVRTSNIRSRQESSTIGVSCDHLPLRAPHRVDD